MKPKIAVVCKHAIHNAHDFCFFCCAVFDSPHFIMLAAGGIAALLVSSVILSFWEA